jgi:hypothetical protein
MEPPLMVTLPPCSICNVPEVKLNVVTVKFPHTRRVPPFNVNAANVPVLLYQDVCPAVIVKPVVAAPFPPLHVPDAGMVQVEEVDGLTNAGIVTAAVQDPEATVAVAVAGQLIVGFVTSTGVTVNVHVEIFPAASVEVIVINVAAEIAVPAAGDCVVVTLPLGVQPSVIVIVET